MAWVRTDDIFPRGRKVKRAALILGGKPAARLGVAYQVARGRVLAVFLDTVSYCNLHETDGFIEDSELGALPDARPEEVFRAMAKGDAELGPLMIRDAKRKGWCIRNYLKYQPSKESREKEREANRERQRLHRERKRNASVTRDNGVSHGATIGVSQVPGPSRPGPSRLEDQEQGQDQVLPTRVG